MSIEGSSEPVRLHVTVTHMVSAIRSSFFSALHFLRRWFLPLVSILLLSCFAKQVLLYSGRLLCNLLFSSKARAARSGPSSSEKNETAKRILIGDVVAIIIWTPVLLCARFFRSFIATRSGISGDVLFARNELNPSSSDSVR